MNWLWLLIISLILLPFIVEFDYRFFNKIAKQNHSRGTYLYTSVFEIIIFILGMVVGSIL